MRWSGTVRYWLIALPLLLISVAVFQKALWFVPADADDLRILSSVARTQNPLSYFANDWGMENTYRLRSGEVDSHRRSYRPLHSISIWAGYRLFGVSAGPNQLLNLILHIANVLLLLRIVLRMRVSDAPAFLICCLALVSMYTASPAIWVSDRQTLAVAFAVLLLLDTAVLHSEALRPRINLAVVGILSVFAVCFKETGIIVPAVAVAAVLGSGNPATARWRQAAICAAWGGAYVCLRVMLFGSNAFAYADEGFVFGSTPYEQLSDLPGPLQVWAAGENVAKNAVSVILPIFENSGRIRAPDSMVTAVLWWMPTAVLAVAATRRPLTKVQWLALAVIAANAAVHSQVFRYRVQYIPQVAFCLYIAASRSWSRGQTDAAAWSRREWTMVGSCAWVLLFSIVEVNQYVHKNWISRQAELTSHRLANVVARYPLDRSVVDRVLKRYAPPAEIRTTNDQ
jgi:hypothetical protein